MKDYLAVGVLDFEEVRNKVLLMRCGHENNKKRRTPFMGTKYKNQKIIFNGETFQSKKEYRRFCELLLLEKGGVISDLQRQVKYVLIPSQKEGKKTIERECSYKADFVYTDNETGETVVEDVKGMRTEVYKIKRKLMLWVHHIKIVEV